MISGAGNGGVTLTSARTALDQKRDEQKREKQQEHTADDLAVAGCIDAIIARGESATTTKIRNEAGISRPRVDRSLCRLVADGLFVRVDGTTVNAAGASHKALVYERLSE